MALSAKKVLDPCFMWFTYWSVHRTTFSDLLRNCVKFWKQKAGAWLLFFVRTVSEKWANVYKGCRWPGCRWPIWNSKAEDLEWFARREKCSCAFFLWACCQVEVVVNTTTPPKGKSKGEVGETQVRCTDFSCFQFPKFSRLCNEPFIAVHVISACSLYEDWQRFRNLTISA